MVILVNQTKEIWRDLTRFAIFLKPKIQITQNKNPVEANYIAHNIILNFYKSDIQLSQKKCSFNDALLLTHAVNTQILRHVTANTVLHMSPYLYSVIKTHLGLENKPNE